MGPAAACPAGVCMMASPSTAAGALLLLLLLLLLPRRRRLTDAAAPTLQVFDVEKHWWALRAIERGYKALYLDSGAPLPAAAAAAAVLDWVLAASPDVNEPTATQAAPCTPLDVATARVCPLRPHCRYRGVGQPPVLF